MGLETQGCAIRETGLLTIGAIAVNPSHFAPRKAASGVASDAR